MKKMRTPSAVLVTLASLLLLTAAAPLSGPGSEELIRRANAAYLRGDIDEADRLYVAAEEATTDPGLVAFNRAAVLFQLGQYREAELNYARVLGDSDCPPDRAARSLYNRGTCLLRRGGSPAIYRSAIRDLDRCLDSAAADEPLKADTRYNLELAKLLWNESRKANAKPDNPNDNPLPEDPQTNPPKSPDNEPQPGTPETGDGNNAGTNTKPAGMQDVATPPGGKTNQAPTPTPGNAPNLQPLQDTDTLQPLTPEDTREYLRRIAERIKRERQSLRNSIYGPERFGHLDW